MTIIDLDELDKPQPQVQLGLNLPLYIDCLLYTSFPPQKTRILGNPRASVAARAQRDPNVVRQLGLDPAIPLVAVSYTHLGQDLSKADVRVDQLEQIVITDKGFLIGGQAL